MLKVTHSLEEKEEMKIRKRIRKYGGDHMVSLTSINVSIMYAMFTEC